MFDNTENHDAQTQSLPIQPEDAVTSEHVYHAVTSKRLSKSPLVYLALIVTFGSIATTALLARSLFTETPQQAARASDRYIDLSYLYKSDIANGESVKTVFKPASLLNLDLLYVLTYPSQYTLTEEFSGIVQISGSKITVSSDNGKFTKDYKLAPEAIFFLDTGKGSLASLGRDYASEFFSKDRKVYFDVLVDKAKGDETVVVVYLTAGPDYKLNIGFLSGLVRNKLRGNSEFTLVSQLGQGGDNSQVLDLNANTKIIKLEELIE